MIVPTTSKSLIYVCVLLSFLGQMHWTTSSAFARQESESTAKELSDANKKLLQDSYDALARMEYTKAKEALEEALKTQSDHPMLLQTMAHTQEKMENWAATEKYLTDWLAVEPHNGFALTSRGFTRMRLSKNTEAKSDFEAALQCHPDSDAKKLLETTIAQIVQAEENRNTQEFQKNLDALTAKSDWAGLEKLWSEVIARNPNDGFALASRGFVRLNLAKPMDAKSDFEAALQCRPTSETKKMLEAAVAQIVQAEENRKTQNFQENLDALTAKSDWAGLEKLWSEVIARNPRDGFALASRGFARLNLAKSAEAKSDFEAALDCHPEEQTKEYLEAAIAQIDEKRQQEREATKMAQFQERLNSLTAQKDWAGLEKLWSEVIMVDPLNAFALSSRGFAREQLGKMVEAKKDFEAALRCDNSEETKAMLESAKAQMELSIRSAEQTQFQLAADKLMAEKNWSELEMHYETFLAKRPDAAFAYADRAFLRRLQQRLDEAEADWREALKHNPDAYLKNTIEEHLEMIETTRKNAVQMHGDMYGAPLGGADYWITANYVEELIKLYSEQDYREVRRLLKNLEERKKTDPQLGLCSYFEGEMLLLDGDIEAAHEKFLLASKYTLLDFYRSEAHWKAANYYREKAIEQSNVEVPPSSFKKAVQFIRAEDKEHPLAVEERFFSTGKKPPEDYRTQNQKRKAGSHAQLSATLLPDNAIRNLDVAYLFLAIDDYRKAIRYFEKSLALPDMKVDMDNDFIYLDLANAYRREDDVRRTHHYLDLYIPLETDKMRISGGTRTKEEVVALYGARRMHADLTRKWGMYSGSFNNSLSNGDSVAQGTNDLYWQPYYSDGRYVQFYWTLIDTFTGRFTTPITTPDGTVHYVGRTNFNDSLYTILGVRFDWCKSKNLVFALERVFKIGRQTSDDVRIRLAHAWERGLEWQPVERRWAYRTSYHEAIYSIEHDNWVLNGELRIGRSYRLDCVNPKLVGTPFLVTSYGFQGRGIENARSWYLESGGGITLRRWYRENKFNAPRSYWDLTLDYRLGLSYGREDMLSLTLFNSY